MTSLTLFSYFYELLLTTQANRLKVTEKGKSVFVSGLLRYALCLPVNMRNFTFAFREGGQRGGCGRTEGPLP